MHRDPPTYKAGYSHTEGTVGDEIAALAEWLNVDHPSHISIIASDKPALDNDQAQRLIRSGAKATSYKPRDAVNVRGRAVLALWLDDAQLSYIDSAQPEALAVAPWLLSEIAIWRYSRKPVEVSGADIPPRPQLDGVVQAAMDELSMMSNPSDGLVSYGKDHAIGTFRVLRDGGHNWDPAVCAAIMAEGGWRLNSAHELRVMATDMLAGKTKRESGSHGKVGVDALERWKESAARAGHDR